MSEYLDTGRVHGSVPSRYGDDLSGRRPEVNAPVSLDEQTGRPVLLAGRDGTTAALTVATAAYH